MVDKVNNPPALSTAYGGAPTVEGLRQTIQDLIGSLIRELSAHAQRINSSIVTTGETSMTAPFVVMTFTVASLPAAATWTQGLVFVSNESGGATLAFSDGTNWRRVQDRAIVS
jgi:hypothetical protein